MKTILRRLVNRVNRVDKRLLIFALLFLNTLSLVLGENEEEYFAFAKAFMDQAWIPGAKSVIDIPGTRIFFDTVIGFALRYATFEQVALVGRCLIALLFAFPLARIFTKLRFTNLESIFLLQLICVLSHQSFFGKEWIFRSFETKTISYVFVFYSLYYLLDTRYLRSVLFAGFAVYFHILVGGWYALLLFVFLLVSGTPLKSILRYALVFSALTAPFGLYLADTYLVDNPGIIDGVRISQIYVYLRNPHHLAIISQIGHWGSSTQIGVILSLLAGWLCMRLYHTSRDEVIRKLALFNIVLFGQQLVSILIALKDTTGCFSQVLPVPHELAVTFFGVASAHGPGETILFEAGTPSRRGIPRRRDGRRSCDGRCGGDDRVHRDGTGCQFVQERPRFPCLAFSGAGSFGQTVTLRLDQKPYPAGCGFFEFEPAPKG